MIPNKYGLVFFLDDSNVNSPNANSRRRARSLKNINRCNRMIQAWHINSLCCVAWVLHVYHSVICVETVVFLDFVPSTRRMPLKSNWITGFDKQHWPIHLHQSTTLRSPRHKTETKIQVKNLPAFLKRVFIIINMTRIRLTFVDFLISRFPASLADF